PRRSSKRASPMDRRAFLQSTAALGVAALAADAEPAPTAHPIVDTHQHLWDRSRFTLPWLADAPETLRRNYLPADYREATRGLDVQKAVYMEVDVTPAQKMAEVDYVVGLGHEQDNPTRGAVVGAVVATDGFADYVRRVAAHKPFVKGMRQVLHVPATPAGTCLAAAFVRGIRLLGENGLSFDLCLRPADLGDAIRLSEQAADTKFILDHCGNADPRAFRRGAENPAHDPAAWRRSIDGLARRPNVVCKISGLINRFPSGFTADDLAPVVDHCLDAFGPDRVVFGGDWPVCLTGGSYRQWVEALRQIVSRRPAEDQRKLWAGNARRLYRLDA
ncbi:MAG TPA: amidohydrolase family protein, partial [Acidimicrobiales bacterium]